MTAHWMLYSLMIASLLVPAAVFLEGSLRGLRRPGRWVWLGAMAGMAVSPLLGVLARAHLSGIGSPSPRTLPLGGLYEVSLPSLQAALGATPSGGVVDLPLALWLGGSSLAFVLLGLGATWLHQKTRSWPRVRVEGEEVLLSDGLGPAVFGFLRPLIVLPPWALELPEAGRALVLMHEDEHRRARDPALLGLGLLMLSLAPWNPLLWIGFFRFRLAVEVDCDQRVLSRGVSRKAYGTLLLRVGTGSRLGMPFSPALSEGNKSQLERRLLMMRRNVRKHPVLAGAAGLVMAAGFLFMACEAPLPPGEALSEAGAIPETEAMKSGPIEGASATFQVEADKARLHEESGVEASGKVKFRFGDGIPGMDDAQPSIYVDGVRLAGGDYLGAKEAIAEIDPDQIERIEVIKGATATATYGEGARNGVILIYMKK